MVEFTSFELWEIILVHDLRRHTCLKYMTGLHTQNQPKEGRSFNSYCTTKPCKFSIVRKSSQYEGL